MIEIGGHAVHAGHYVNGERQAETADFEVFSPIDGAVLGAMAEAGPDTVVDAVGAAAAFPAWAGLGAEGDFLTWSASRRRSARAATRLRRRRRMMPASSSRACVMASCRAPC